jgi:nitroreductase
MRNFYRGARLFILLASSEIGVGACPVSGFVDTKVQEILDLTENEIPI